MTATGSEPTVEPPSPEPPGLRRAVVLMSASSFVVPVAGLVTQPILAQSLGADGRGELAAALAPAALAIAVATLGLPDALLYYLAKYPSITRRAMAWAALLSAVIGAACLLGTMAALPFLSTGDAGLGGLIMLATAFAVPALIVGVLRGAATGRQMWSEVAVERVINAALRIAGLGGLLLLGQLTVLSALWVSVLTPLVAAVVYWRLLLPVPAAERGRAWTGSTLRPLLGYGSRVWLGSVASMLVARVGQVLMAPLSDVTQLGYFSVATTVADVPLIVALAISGALAGVNSRSQAADQITATARLTTLAGTLGCVALAVAVPFAMTPLFGAEFGDAVLPTLMLLAAAVICIPGLMAGAGLSAWGRPGLRSLALTVTLVVNVSFFLLLVPSFGAIGACWTTIITNVVLSGAMVIAAARVMDVPVGDFLLIRGSDVARLWREGRRLGRSLLRRGVSFG